MKKILSLLVISVIVASCSSKGTDVPEVTETYEITALYFAKFTGDEEKIVFKPSRVTYTNNSGIAQEYTHKLPEMFRVNSSRFAPDQDISSINIKEFKCSTPTVMGVLTYWSTYKTDELWDFSTSEEVKLSDRGVSVDSFTLPNNRKAICENQAEYISYEISFRASLKEINSGKTMEITGKWYGLIYSNESGTITFPEI